MKSINASPFCPRAIINVYGSLNLSEYSPTIWEVQLKIFFSVLRVRGYLDIKKIGKTLFYLYEKFRMSSRMDNRIYSAAITKLNRALFLSFVIFVNSPFKNEVLIDIYIYIATTRSLLYQFNELILNILIIIDIYRILLRYPWCNLQNVTSSTFKFPYR